MGLYFEEFAVGRRFDTAGRTVGEGDITTFAGLAGDFTPIHMDEHYARQTAFGGRIAHGPLTLAMAIGLLTQRDVLGEGVVALLNLNWDFQAPVMIGDTLRAGVVVESTRLASRGDSGVVGLRFDLRNQRGEPVQNGLMTVLMRCRPAVGDEGDAGARP